MCNQARKKEIEILMKSDPCTGRSSLHTSQWLAAIWFPWPLHSRYEAMPTYIPEGRLTQIRVSLFPPKSCLRHLEKNETPGYKSHPLMREMSWSISPPSWHGWHFFFFLVFSSFFSFLIFPQRNQLSDASPKERGLQIRRNLFQTQKPPDAR